MRTVLAFSCLLAAIASAQQVCSTETVSTELQYLRRLTLDLSGRVPSADELQAVLSSSRVAPSTVDALLEPAVVKQQLRRLVRQQLQANIRLPLQNDFALSRTTAADVGLPVSDALWVVNRSQTYRPRVNGPATERVPCWDEPQTAFDPQGLPIATARADGYLREGWLLVHPYWEADPTATVKICAFDAQTAMRVTLQDGRQLSCADHASVYLAPACGCGPDLQWCQGQRADGQDTETMINQAFTEQAMRLVDRIVDEGRPWSELLTLRELDVNGPLAHWLRFQTATATEFSSRADLGFTPPALAFTDPRWTRVTLTGRASGVLTTPFYLLKFASNRARANQFFNAFTCTPLQAPGGGLPNATDPCSREPDLARRCGCSACHSSLEPAAASWGRYVERGTWELTDAEFPSTNPACVSPDGGLQAVSASCQTHYRAVALNAAEVPFVGQLKGRLFLDTEGRARFEAGPSRWAAQSIASGAYAECTVRKLWESFVGRPFFEELDDEQAQLARLKSDFIGSNHDMQRLLRAIVTSKQYRNAEFPRGGAR